MVVAGFLGAIFRMNSFAGETTSHEDKKLGLIEKAGKWGFHAAPEYHENLPRVIIIGDSICSQYSQSVREKMRGIADVDAWTTAANINNNYLHERMRVILSIADYKVVHFNHGLHGYWDGRVPKSKYESLMESYVKEIKKNAPDAVIVWASTTSVSKSKKEPHVLDPIGNKEVLLRNAMALKVMKRNGIPIDDLYTLMIKNIDYKADRFHYKSKGVEIMADAVADTLKNALKKVREKSSATVVASEHSQIGNIKEKMGLHTAHPDAQWFPDAGLGLFLHWGISSVIGMNISHPMVVGRPLEKKRIADPEERARIVREQDYYLNGKKPEITPDDYFKLAESFSPREYHPEKWLAKVKDAGFKYVVLTAKHHEGFAMWPSKYGSFNTKNYMGGRDLIGEFVAACHKLDLKVGLYYSGPDWYFDRDYMSFMRSRAYKINPEFPQLGTDLLPRERTHTKAEKEAHYAKFLEMVNGQVEELLSNYGKIDVIWFDGKPSIPNSYRKKLVTKERIRELQPGIVINPRMHGKADYITFERHLPETIEMPKGQWAEFCNPWNGTWPYTKRNYKPLNNILNDLLRCRANGINYLLGFGPMGNGDLAPDAYKNMKLLEKWMNANSESVYAVKPLPEGEVSSVLASSKGGVRYLYLPPSNKDITVTLRGVTRPVSVAFLKNNESVPFEWKEKVLSFIVQGKDRSQYYDVVKINL